jgi:uncharacterized protein (DUF58 family)
VTIASTAPTRSAGRDEPGIPVSLAPRRDSRALAYTVLALVLGAIGLLAGRAEPLAAAAGLAAVLFVGLRRVEPLAVEPMLTVESRRLIAGDPVRATLAVDHPPSHHLDLMIVEPSGALGPIEYRSVVERSASTTVEIVVPTPEWGKHHLGYVVVRAHTDGSMCVWEDRVLDLGTVTVLPRPERLTSLLAPRATRASAGGHPAHVLGGGGSEFVDIRGYQPGDRLRDVNWKVTARRGEPHVNRRRPERGGEVVIVLDATSDGWRQSDLGSALLQCAGQAVWSLARNHLAAQDRVGLLTQQSNGVDWLPPEGGMRARYRVIETLLGANSSQRSTSRSAIRRHDVPPAALVLGVSSLSNNLTLRTLAAMRAHGHTVGVLAIDAARLLRETDELDAASARLATMLFDAHVQYVRRLGLPVIPWQPGADPDRAITRLAEMTRRSVRTVPA